MQLIKHKVSRAGKVYKPSKPFLAKVLKNEPLMTADTQDQIQHLVIDIAGSNLQFLEGQSIGVIPPGQRADGRPNKVRLYSIASARYGEYVQPEENASSSTNEPLDANADTRLAKNLALCVKKDVHQDQETGELGYGLCSKYLCEIPIGSNIQITGPVGRSFLLPEDPNELLIMIGVGTGIAPYRAFLQYLNTLHGWSGNCELYFGCKTKAEALYLNQTNQDLLNWQQKTQFAIHSAFSRQQTTADGQRLYVQHLLKPQLQRLWGKILKQEACVYICGLKNMQQGIEQVMQAMALEGGQNWDDLKRTLRTNGRWNVEVY